ncbi:MAG: DNA polymerase III subunit alpha, partial [Chlorobiales bacterium]|nr:DNA polymerase III subunit alpha [Chlorobiales bacterium]
MVEFVHLHTHTHYSMQSSTIMMSELFGQCKKLGMSAVAVTDYASMFNMPELFSKAKKNDVKLIIGSEIFVVPGIMSDKKQQEVYHLILLVKNETGYQNMSRILSAAARDGFYQQRPRVDLKLITAHAEGLICLTACEEGELSKMILRDNYNGAKKFVQTYKEIFKDDFYIELQYHNAPNDEKLNQEKIKLAEEFSVKVVATNDVHYLEKKDAPLQDALQSIRNKQTQANSNRPKLPTEEFYLKSADEMARLFNDEHQELTNTLEIADKCTFKFQDQDPRLPHFEIPEGFKDDSEYLTYLTFEGAKRKYGDIDAMGEEGKVVRDRINFELDIISKMGYCSYFLIVSDLIAASRKMGYSVGPGRGSAAGSIVAYLTDITQVDPIKYKLLFERFLNPERISMPDIDIDFTPVGKQKVLEYTIQKYGEESVAKVIAVGTLGAKAAIRDVGRFLDIPLLNVDKIAKLVPSKPGTTLPKALEQVKELDELRKDPDQKIRKLIDYSIAVEGRARNVSMHAGAVVITNGPIENFVPLYVSNKIETEERRYADEDDEAGSEGDEKKAVKISSKDEKQVVTQFDKDWIEKAGLLKIDYLGLETLAVIDETLRLIERRHGVKIDLERTPIDDKSAYRIFQEGKMAGIFQFESQGMQQYMMQLRPTVIGDIIAMSALYRPGALNARIDEKRNAVDLFVDRKNGREKIEYMHPMLSEILEETYGVIVYQEQVMQISQVMGGFSLAKADNLRKAMGKKQPEVMAKFKGDFVQGAIAQGVEDAVATRIFDLMAEFAGYGFNKSHSAAYGVLAYWTAYLKAHYTAEFITAILNSEAGDTARMKHLTDEAKSMGLKILPPSINKSDALFTVEDLKNGKNAIRVGFSAIKHVGGAAKEIVTARRRRKQDFKNIFDLCSSVDLRVVNKKALECLAEAGALDELEENRAMMIANLPKAIEYGQKRNKSATLGQEGFFSHEEFFTEESDAYPEMIKVEPWKDAEKLQREKTLVGFYLSNHPLETYRRDYEAFS